MAPDVPAVLAFHLGEPNGSAHRIIWDGRVVRYTRWREGFEPLRVARTSGEGAWPAEFAGLKRALWALLGDPPAV